MLFKHDRKLIFEMLICNVSQVSRKLQTLFPGDYVAPVEKVNVRNEESLRKVSVLISRHRSGDCVSPAEALLDMLHVRHDLFNYLTSKLKMRIKTD